LHLHQICKIFITRSAVFIDWLLHPHRKLASSLLLSCSVFFFFVYQGSFYSPKHMQSPDTTKYPKNKGKSKGKHKLALEEEK
jgi:hypothetical protein